MLKLKIKIFLIFTLLIGINVPSLVLGKGLKMENEVVGRIDVITACSALDGTPITPQMIKSRLKTKEGEIFSQSAFDSDLKLLVKEYDRVEPFVESVKGKIYITLKIRPKPKIQEILFRGNEKVKTSKLLSELGIRAGSLFDSQEFNKAFHKLKTYYVKNGFFEAELSYDTAYDESCNAIEITVNIQEGRAGKIKRIIFTDFTKCEQEELLDLMVTKKYNMFLSWFTGEGIYNEEMIQHDEFQILNYLQNQGFADAVVDINVCEADESNRIFIYIKAKRGPKYYFGDISIEGNHLFSEQELLEPLCVQKGENFSPEQLHNSIQELTDRYGRLGYIEAIVNYEPNLIENACVYDVKITIDEGGQYHVGMIKVMGNCSTKTKVILHETLLIPGEVFDLDKLKITEARLCNIGYFKNVNVYAVKSEADCVLPENYRDVHIEVEEANTGHLGAFLGFSTVEEIFGGINLSERNFNLEGLSRIGKDGFRALRGGGEYAHITLSLGNKTSEYSLSWTKPYFNDTLWSVGFDISRGYNQYISDDYEIYTYALVLHADYQYNPFLRTGTHYRLKYGDIHIHEDCKGQVCCDECKPLKKLARNDGLISAIGVNWLYDSTNNPLKPSCGLKSRLECEIAGVGGDWSFVSFGYLNSYYYDLCGHGVVKFKGDLRFIQPLGSTGPDNIPLDERFFLGGDNGVRGYRPYRIGPKFCHKSEDPKGGLSMQLASIEYTKSLLPFADIFFFFDTGSLSMDRWRFGKFYHSVGYGARVKMFGGMPPITLGMGYPINAKNKSDVKRFFISAGGKF